MTTQMPEKISKLYDFLSDMMGNDKLPIPEEDMVYLFSWKIRLIDRYGPRYQPVYNPPGHAYKEQAE